MAFRTFLYLDSKKVAEYSTIIHASHKPLASRKSLSGTIDVGVAKIGAEIESTSPETVKLNPAILYDEFESALQKSSKDDYFDCSINTVDMTTLPPMSIARCEGNLEIPDNFDMLAMISKYLPYLNSLGLISLDGDPTTNEFALSFFEKTNADIPILIRGNDILVASKLKSESFVDSNYQTLEDYEDEDLFILFKVHSIVHKDSVVVFDPAKDFLKLNRSLRRSIKNTKELEPITVPGPVLKAEIIAIYH